MWECERKGARKMFSIEEREFVKLDDGIIYFLARCAQCVRQWWIFLLLSYTLDEHCCEPRLARSMVPLCVNEWKVWKERRKKEREEVKTYTAQISKGCFIAISRGRSEIVSRMSQGYFQDISRIKYKEERACCSLIFSSSQDIFLVMGPGLFFLAS